jgi:hypothetical protein
MPPSKFRDRLKATELLGKYGRIFLRLFDGKENLGRRFAQMSF